MPYFLEKSSAPFAVYRLANDAATRVGREQISAQIVLDKDGSVSRLHCEFNIQNDQHITLTDLNSRFGTFVNEEKLESSSSLTKTLQVGDKIRLGPSGLSTFVLKYVPIILCLSSMTEQEKSDMKAAALQIGADVRHDFDESVTHVVIPAKSWKVTTKLIMGLLCQKQIVTINWVHAFAKSKTGGVPDPQKYPPGPMSANQISTLNATGIASQSQQFQPSSHGGGGKPAGPDFSPSLERQQLFSSFAFFVIPRELKQALALDVDFLRLGGAKKIIYSDDEQAMADVKQCLVKSAEANVAVVCDTTIDSFRKTNAQFNWLPCVDKNSIISCVLASTKLVPSPPAVTQTALEAGEMPPPELGNMPPPTSTNLAVRKPKAAPTTTTSKSSSVNVSIPKIQPPLSQASSKIPTANASAATVDTETSATTFAKASVGTSAPPGKDSKVTNGKQPDAPSTASSRIDAVVENAEATSKFSSKPQGDAQRQEQPYTVTDTAASADLEYSSRPRVLMQFDENALSREQSLPMSSHQAKGKIENRRGKLSLPSAAERYDDQQEPPKKKSKYGKQQKDDAFALNNDEDDYLNNSVVVHTYGNEDLQKVKTKKEQSFEPPTDSGWLMKPSKKPDQDRASSFGEEAVGREILEPVVETEDLVVVVRDTNQQHKSPTRNSSKRSVAPTTMGTKSLIDHKKFRKNRIIPSSGNTQKIHKATEVVIEPSIADQLAERNLKVEEARMLEAFGGRAMVGRTALTSANKKPQPSMNDFMQKSLAPNVSKKVASKPAAAASAAKKHKASTEVKRAKVDSDFESDDDDDDSSESSTESSDIPTLDDDDHDDVEEDEDDDEVEMGQDERSKASPIKVSKSSTGTNVAKVISSTTKAKLKPAASSSSLNKRSVVVVSDDDNDPVEVVEDMKSTPNPPARTKPALSMVAANTASRKRKY